MSWDIFVQDLPPNASSIADIPSGFKPKSLGITRAKVIETIKEVAPGVDLSDPSCLRVAVQGCFMDVNLGHREDLDGFVFHVYGGDSSRSLIGHVLKKLGLRALDPASDSGFFDPATSDESFRRWQAYRSQILAKHRPT